ncbi:hypothetical protein L9F63_024170, partial [Diploptera punctata]
MRFFTRVFERSSEEENKSEFTDEAYFKKAKGFLETAWDIVNSTDNWKLEKKTANGDTVESKIVPGLGTVFKAE